MDEFRFGKNTLRAPSAMLLALAFAGMTACKDRSASEALSSDSTLGRDLAMAQADSVQPELKDVPPPVAEKAPATESTVKKPTTTPKPAPKPTAPAPKPTTSEPAATPAPAPAPAAPVQGVVAAGTSLHFKVNNKVCSNTVVAGDKFTATLTESVAASNGIQIPAGASAVFEVTEAKTAKNSNDDTYLRIHLVSISYGEKQYAVNATIQDASTERVRSASKGTDAKKVAGGAILGAIVGQVIGKNTKGTVIGAAAGAAAGTAAAAATADFDTCVSSGAIISAVLDAPLTVRPAPTP